MGNGALRASDRGAMRGAAAGARLTVAPAHVRPGGLPLCGVIAERARGRNGGAAKAGAEMGMGPE